jgi:hypothetical protein
VTNDSAVEVNVGLGLNGDAGKGFGGHWTDGLDPNRLPRKPGIAITDARQVRPPDGILPAQSSRRRWHQAS